MNLYDFLARRSGAELEEGLDLWRGKAVLVVNVASKCGFTPQYAGLQVLYDEYRDRGFAVLGFPCDQFAHQEPGDDEEIRSFCTLKYGVNFPLYSKIDVNGRFAHPLFRWLRMETKSFLTDRIKWNFTKFLVDREGNPVKRYGPNVEPSELRRDIERVLAADAG